MLHQSLVSRVAFAAVILVVTTCGGGISLAASSTAAPSSVRTASARAESPVLVAAFALHGDASDARAELVHQAVRGELLKIEGIQLLSTADARFHLEAARKMGLDCAIDDSPCLAKLGAVAGTARIVASKTRREGAKVELTMRIVDVKDPGVSRTAYATIADGEELLPGVTRAVAALFSHEPSASEGVVADGATSSTALGSASSGASSGGGSDAQPDGAPPSGWRGAAIGTASVGAVLVVLGGVSLAVWYGAASAPFAGDAPTAEQVRARKALLTSTGWAGAGLLSAGVSGLAAGAGLVLFGSSLASE